MHEESGPRLDSHDPQVRAQSVREWRRPKALSVLREAEQDMRIWLAEEIAKAERDVERNREGALREVKDKLVELGLISGVS